MTIRSTAGCNSVRSCSRPPRCSLDGRTAASNPPRCSLGACGIFVFIEKSEQWFEINQIRPSFLLHSGSSKSTKFIPPFLLLDGEVTGSTRRPYSGSMLLNSSGSMWLKMSQCVQNKRHQALCLVTSFSSLIMCTQAFTLHKR
jgi:hypothetical protein